MSLSAENSRRGSSWGGCKGLCVIVFAVTAAAVYLWGPGSAGWKDQSKARRSTATVLVRTAATSEAAGKAVELHPGLLCPDPEVLKQELTSEVNLRRALERLGRSAGPSEGGAGRTVTTASLEQLRQNLQVAAAESSTPGEIRISISCADPEIDCAVGLVNDLAEHYAEGCRAKLQADSQKTHSAARDSAHVAHQQLLQAKLNLEGFLERHFRQHESLAKRRPQPPEAPVAQIPPQSPPGLRETQAPPAPDIRPNARLVDSPEWINLSQQVAELFRYRSEMLTKRTPMHPEVQDLDARISDLQQHLATIPRQVPEKSAGLQPKVGSPADRGSAAPSPTTTPRSDAPSTAQAPDAKPAAPAGTIISGQTAEEHAEAAQTYWALQAAMDRAAQTNERLARAEREAWQEQFRTSRVDLELAQPPSVHAPSGHWSQRLWIALAAAAALTSGVGMLWMGATVEKTFTSAEQARAMLPVPIVGIITESGLRVEADPRQTTGASTALAWILGGLILISGCLAILAVTRGS